MIPSEFREYFIRYAVHILVLNWIFNSLVAMSYDFLKSLENCVIFYENLSCPVTERESEKGRIETGLTTVRPKLSTGTFLWCVYVCNACKNGFLSAEMVSSFMLLKWPMAFAKLCVCVYVMLIHTTTSQIWFCMQIMRVQLEITSCLNADTRVKKDKHFRLTNQPISV